MKRRSLVWAAVGLLVAVMLVGAYAIVVSNQSDRPAGEAPAGVSH